MGALFGLLFYLLVVFAAISSSISLLEVIVAHFVDKAREAGKGDKRKTYSLVAALGCGGAVYARLPRALGTKGIAPANILGIADPEDMGGRLAGLLRLHLRGNPDAVRRAADVDYDRLGARAEGNPGRVVSSPRPQHDVLPLLPRLRALHHTAVHAPDPLRPDQGVLLYISGRKNGCIDK